MKDDLKITFRYAKEDDRLFFIDMLLNDNRAAAKLMVTGNDQELFKNTTWIATIIAEIEGKPVGFIKIQEADSTGFNYINELFVIKDYRRKGIGKALMEFAMNYAYTNWMGVGIDIFTLDNKPMDSLLKKLGFILSSHDKKRYYRAGKFIGQKRWYKLYK